MKFGNLLEAALFYAARGWKVFPLEPGSKGPHGNSADVKRLGATRRTAHLRVPVVGPRQARPGDRAQRPGGDRRRGHRRSHGIRPAGHCGARRRTHDG